MIIKVANKKLQGSINAISSKSYAQRAIMAALLAKEKSQIKINTMSADIEVALRLVCELGGLVISNNSLYTIVPPKEYKKNQILHVGESGTSLRFLIPIIAALGVGARIYREGSLVKRPNDIYMELLPKHGVEIYEEGPYIIVKGNLKYGEYHVAGNISSQFISGLLLALGYLRNESKIKITTEIGSKKYIDMTIAVLKEFGITVTEGQNEYLVDGKYHGCKYNVEGDWSNSLFFLVAGVEVLGLNKDSLQADRNAIEVIELLGYKNISEQGLAYRKVKEAPLYRIIDAQQMPDAMPILAVLAAINNGRTRIINISRLRLKESDRVNSIISVLKALGVKAKLDEESIVIDGVDEFLPCALEAFNDHRIAMMLAIASNFASGDIIIKGAECVNKSYPSFFEDLKKVGARWEILSEKNIK